MLIIGSIAVALAVKSLCPGVLFYPVGIVYVVYIGFTIYTDIVFIKNHNPIFPFLAVFPSWIAFWMAIVAWSNSIIPDNVIFMNMDYVFFGALLFVHVLGAVPMIVLLFISTGIPALVSDLQKRNKSSKK